MYLFFFSLFLVLYYRIFFFFFPSAPPFLAFWFIFYILVALPFSLPSLHSSISLLLLLLIYTFLRHNSVIVVVPPSFFPLRLPPTFNLDLFFYSIYLGFFISFNIVPSQSTLYHASFPSSFIEHVIVTIQSSVSFFFFSVSLSYVT